MDCNVGFPWNALQRVIDKETQKEEEKLSGEEVVEREERE